MKHLVLTQFGTPSESVALHDDGDPVPGPGDVLVRMEAAAVNPSDLLLLRGLYLAGPNRRRRSAVKAAESSWTPGRRPTRACWASG
jgi:NADPH:quinone reductase-like Zn-dependent oxidoreductase